jgi:hypothetical protein
VIGPDRRYFKQLVDEVLSWGGMSSDTNRLRQLAKYAVAESHRKRLSSYRWSFMLYPVPQTIAVSAGTDTYPLHDAFLTPQYFRSRTDGRPLRPVPFNKVAEYLPDPAATSGTPRHVTLTGVTKVQYQPTSASVIAGASTAPGDNGKTVTITGETATGIQSETIALPASTTLAFSTVLDVRKNGAGWAGTLSLTSNGGAITLLKLGPAQYGRQFPLIRSLNVPDSADTWEYNFFRQPKSLADDYDIPDTPEPFASIHVVDALLAMQDRMRPTAGMVRDWQRQQIELEADLIATYQHGLTQDSEADYVTLIDRG